MLQHLTIDPEFEGKIPPLREEELQHPEIQFTAYEKQFPDRYAAIAWICKNQLGRRNLMPMQVKCRIGEQIAGKAA